MVMLAFLYFLSFWCALGVVCQPEWGQLGESGRNLMSSASQHHHQQRQEATKQEPVSYCICLICHVSTRPLRVLADWAAT